MVCNSAAEVCLLQWEVDPWGRWRVYAKNGQYEALVEASCSSPGTPLRAPTADSGLDLFCRDSFYGKVRCVCHLDSAFPFVRASLEVRFVYLEPACKLRQECKQGEVLHGWKATMMMQTRALCQCRSGCACGGTTVRVSGMQCLFLICTQMPGLWKLVAGPGGAHGKLRCGDTAVSCQRSRL